MEREVKINNFTMPESCNDCQLKHEGKYSGHYICNLTRQFVDGLFLIRHDMCPLDYVREE